jgi:hypothetical protein
MTTFETISATLGILGFVIAATNAVWTFRHQRPGLLITPRSGHLFDADITGERGHFPIDPPRRAKIVDIVMDVSNCSARNNSVVSINWRMDGVISPLDPEAKYEVGQRIIDLSRVFGKSRSHVCVGEYWNYPRQWEDDIPAELTPGTSRQAHCSGEVKDIAALGNPPRFKISIFDAYGRTYAKTILLKHGQPTHEGVNPLNDDVGMSEVNDSKETV